jgi:arylsulfatase A-like enzyme
MNVILVLVDTLRRDHLGAYGGPPTPGFDRLAALGVTFDRYFLGSYPCMPARRDLWTGRYEFPWRGWGPLLPGDRDLPSLVAASGARTMLVTDHYHLFQPGAGNYHFGFDGWEFIRGQEDDHWRTADGREVPWAAEPERKLHRRWARYWRNTAERRAGLRWRSEEDTFAARTFGTAEAWLREHSGGGAPFFLMIDCFDPHEPFDPPPALWPRGVAAGVPWPIYGRADRYTPEELEGIRALYAAEVALVDACFGRFLETCARLGRLDDTLILLTTDHGHLFGEHGMIGKPSTVHGDSNLYRPLAHVPLLAYHPEGRGAGARLPVLAQTVDLLPTVLEAMGIPLPAAAAESGLHGQSLLPYLTGRRVREPLRPLAFYAKFGEAVQATDGELVLHQWPAGAENGPLYWYGHEPPAFLRPRGLGAFEPLRGRYPVDWERGPCRTVLLDEGEARDLAGERPAEAARLQAGLRSWLREIGAPAEQAERLGL